MCFAHTKGSFVPSKIQDEDAVINYMWPSIAVAAIKYKIYRKTGQFANNF